MTNDAIFVGRGDLLSQLSKLYSERKHVLVTGPAGIGKTVLLRQACAHLQLLVCEESRSLGRICDDLERQAGLRDRKQKIVERKRAVEETAQKFSRRAPR
jgi:ABC-type molybdenum transport system ATPase subunit/photorepair protein PhrA